jgi:hypothetical protein
MSTLSATNLKNASSGSNNIVLGTSGQTTVNGDLLFNSGYGSAATAYGCRAWVNFNGTSTVAIRASGNVSSITDNGTGDYTVNFTTAMVDANYCTVATSNVNTTGSGNRVVSAPYAASPTVSALRLACFRADTAVFEDHAFINVAIFR